MKIPLPPHKRVLYSTGTLESTKRQNVVDKLVSSRPFTEQLDIVFSSSSNSEDLKRKLEQLNTVYNRRQWTLTGFIQFVQEHRFEIASTNDDSEGHDRSVIAVGLSGPSDDDSWCFDGDTLTISAGEATWQRFNLGEGSSLPWREHKSTKYYRFALAKLAELSAKLKASFKAWDDERGPWDVIYHHNIDSPTNGESESVAHVVQPVTRIARNVHLPPPQLPQSPPLDKEDWEEEVSTYFEWVGLATLGSQRLQVNDKPDPYIAVYEPPDGSKAGDLVHLRWKGLISCWFLRIILKTVSENHSMPFISIAGHAVLQSPVTYVGSNGSQQRIPGRESEDSWSLMLCREERDGQQITRWILGESVGKWDSRLG